MGILERIYGQYMQNAKNDHPLLLINGLTSFGSQTVLGSENVYNLQERQTK